MDLPEVPVGKTTGGWSDLTYNYFGREYNEVGTQVPETDWHLGEAWVKLPICSGQYHRSGQLGALCWLGEHVDLHTMPSDVCIAMYIDGPKWRNGAPPYGMGIPLDIIQTEFLGHGRVGNCRGSDPFAAAPFPLHLFGAAEVTQT